MADKTTVQITEDNIDELNIKVGTILKDNEGLYWKITDFNEFTAGMKVCDKDGNELENFVGNTKRAIFGGGLSDLLNDGVTTYFVETEQSEIKKDVRYNYFVKDTAEFEQFADFEPITNLTAEEAVRTLIELNIKKGLSAGIGINIPDDFIFDDPDGNGAIIFMKTNDEYSFYMGDNFVKELKENNEHAQNVIAAFKELDNVIKTSVLGDIEVYKKPDFLYAKEKELFGDNKQENISETEIEEEKQIIQKRIQWLKNALEHPDVNNPDDEQYVSETKEYINRLENMSDDEIRNLVIWKKETQKKNEEIHKHVVEQMKKEEERKNTPQNGELLSYNETHPIYSLINKETGRQIVIQPSGKVEDNVKELGRLKNLTEAKEVIEKIKATGFNMYSTESRIVLFNDDKFYDFDKFADFRRFNFRTEQFEYNIDNRNLKDWDFKYYIDHGFKITKQMKEFEKIGATNMEKKEIKITPVSLEEILGVMEMKPEVTPEGRIQIYDQQLGEYISTWVGQGDGDLGFEHATEIFERLDIYINDYFIHDMEDQLEAGGVTLRGDETLKDLCDYAKEQLEAGITTVSQGELNLAMGIVNPDTVIMPDGFLERTETTTFTLKNTTSEQIAELKEHLSMNGYDVSWKEKSKDSTDIQFSANFDEESWISTILDERNLTYTRSYEHSEEEQIKENMNKSIEIIQSARTAKWKNERGEELVIFVQKQLDGKKMLAFGKSENYGNALGKYDNSDGSFTLLSEYTHSLYWSFCFPDQTESLTLEEQKIFNDVMEKYNPDFKKSVSENVDTEKEKILEQCNKIIEKFSNTHFTEQEQKLVNEYEKEESDRHQALMSLCNMKYIHCTSKDKDGYWEIKKGKEISANEARKLMSYDDFASGLDTASFHLTAGRNANDGSFVYFNDSERKRDIQPYELTKEDYLLLSQYEKAGGSTEIIPEAILQQLLQYNINANIENPKILSWQEIEDYFSARNVRETKNEVLESFTESQEKPAEKELKEECVARLLKNQIDFYGFDTNKTDDKLNSEISVAKWDVLEKIAEKTVSKELDLKPYAVIQEEADKLLMENSVFQECIKNGIISEPDFLLKTENKKDIELTAEDIKNAKALLPKEQYQLVLGYTQGEEGEHFKGIIKEISSKAEAIKGKKEILTEDEKHPLAFKYIMGASSFYFSEWDGGDELYGYVVLNGNTQDSEWGYTSLEKLKNSGSKDRNGFPVIPEMIFYGLEDTIEKQISVDYPELTEQIGIKPKLNHNEELISEFGKEIFETLQSRKLEQSAYNICCAAQFVIRTMDSSEQKEIFSIMKKCGCEGKNGKANTEDFLTEVVRAENNTASSAYDRKRLYEKINKACPPKKAEAGKGIHNQENDYEMEI
ncbi:hypothetical protein [uncultured Treponema sp.]|uniref:hypothetical protein n=1 Tax=uncultured Treponema sp. TaxID=162155 RepID=UPI002591D068|nr:hypothetical protein [uncultured Treponema sp.]